LWPVVCASGSRLSSSPCWLRQSRSSSSNHSWSPRAQLRESLAPVAGGQFQHLFERLFRSVWSCRIILSFSGLFCRFSALWELQCERALTITVSLFAPDCRHRLNPRRSQCRQERSSAANDGQCRNRAQQHPGIARRRSVQKACQGPGSQERRAQTSTSPECRNRHVFPKHHGHHSYALRP
jgi:hypothetical protein